MYINKKAKKILNFMISLFKLIFVKNIKIKNSFNEIFQKISTSH